MSRFGGQVAPANGETDLERVTGLRTPARDAPPERWREWFVASMFVRHHRAIADPTEARAAAATDVLRRWNHEDYLPLLETALGRPLTEAEIAAREVTAESCA